MRNTNSQIQHDTDVTLLTSCDMRCQFSTQIEVSESHVHYPKFASFARVVVLRR